MIKKLLVLALIVGGAGVYLAFDSDEEVRKLEDPASRLGEPSVSSSADSLNDAQEAAEKSPLDISQEDITRAKGMLDKVLGDSDEIAPESAAKLLHGDSVQGARVEPSARTLRALVGVASQWDESSLKQAVLNDPEETPAELRKFSAEMGEVMFEVLANPAEQPAAFAELERCSLNLQLASPVRALCAANAKRLSLADPEKFSDSLKKLETKWDAEIRDFVSQVKQVR